MTLAWDLFTPWPALAGGLLIGIAASLYMLGNGRIAGIASLMGAPLTALLSGQGLAAQGLRLCFLAGLMLAPWLWQLAAPLPIARVDVGPLGLIAGGLLVGVGVSMGKGCTSGHGVCGLSRLSLRSLVNVLCFMGAGFLTVFVARHLL
jgi:uncharacterized membrane protein YedE/YeeE